ncbi:PepSY domain-containing protein [Labrenzia sp. CE80]|uniref:PepSY domain-containing protein n=1 Tax=Labrenzia sp. CE80 TaxID=1788986 RepID=UPI00129BD3F6|nr:PepSY domain-containing protein [Labrenzia sp. CE80]
MMMLLKNPVLALGVIVAFNGTAFAGVEKSIELSAVPAGVMDVAKEALTDLKLVDATKTGDVNDGLLVDDDSIVVVYELLGEVTIASANTETEEDGSFVYEIQGTFVDGRKVEVDIDPNGKVHEIEIEFEIEDVPGAVRNAIEKQLPGFKPSFIEASHSQSMKVVNYEFVGMMGDAKMDIEASADGRRIVVADQ